MQQRPGQLRYGLVATASTLAVVGLFAALLRGTVTPRGPFILPSLLLATTLCEVAIVVLAAVLLEQARSRWYLPLVIGSLVCALLDFTTFLVIPLPGASTGAIARGARVIPWLHTLACIVFGLGGIWYAGERARRSTISAVDARSLWLTWSLVAAFATLAYVVLMVHAAARLPAILAGNDISGYRTTGLGWVALGILAASVAVTFALLLNTSRRQRIDEAVALGMLAAAIGTFEMLTSNFRYDLPWVAMRVFTLAAALIIVVGLIRQLVDRLGDALRAEAMLLRAEATAFEQNAAVEASLVKSRFVAAVSHELRTPLGGIIGMAELLERTHLDDRQRICTTAIRTSADTLHRIVNDLLDFSRVEAGMLEFEEVPFDLSQLVDDVVVLFREQARQKDVALHSFVAPSLPDTVTGDPTRIKQVLQNLVNNAVRFTETGSIRVDVQLARWGEAQMLEFSVRDSGIGIAESAHDRIFNAFTQEDASTARRFGGTGLGLAIARHLVERMGGSIRLRSTVGVGSTFTFTIPLRARCADRTAAMPLRDMRILVVESNPAIRDLLHGYVAGWEMRAHTVTSPDIARAVAASHTLGDLPYAVLLVGPSTPPDDASRLAHDLRDVPALAGADCIYIWNDDFHDGASPAGFDASISGPLRQSTLFNTIARHLVERKVETIGAIAPRRPRRERILVAEDNEINQTLLVAQLEHLGFQALVVGDGNAAIAAAQATAFDLIFMDCQMPGIDGFEAARRIRADESPSQTVPIIAVTANVLPGYRDICVAAGMNDYLAKPALIEPLARIIDHWLPLTGDAPPAAVPVPAMPVSQSAASVDIRRRLRDIFRGDDERVEATIALALSSLSDGLSTLRSAVAGHDATVASRMAHKLKGIAMEIGLVEIAEQARQLEENIDRNDWHAADATVERFATAIASESQTAQGAVP